MKLHAFLVAILSTAVASAATVDSVSIKQLWPVSTDVKVTYKLSGVTDPVDIKVEILNGESAVSLAGVDRSFLRGDVYGVTGDDTPHTLFIDPTQLKAVLPGYASDFKVKLSTVASAANIGEVIYRIVNLNSGEITDVTRAEIKNGKYGTWTDDVAETFGTTNSVDDVLVWTGVTKDPKWAKDYMVFRKIPAGGKVHRIGSQVGEVGADSSREKPYYAKLTHDYWMGVFEVTQYQYAKFAAKFPNVTPEQQYPSKWKDGPDAELKPVDSVGWTYIRGTGDAKWSQQYEWSEIYSSADTYRFVGLLRALNPTALARLDLPSDAQWEVAARAGVLATHYDGFLNVSGSNGPADKSMEKLGRFSGNGGVVDNVDQGPVRVGSYAPNAYGLYDVLGNLYEWTGDVYMECPANQVAEGDEFVVDPKGGIDQLAQDDYNGGGNNYSRSPYHGGAYNVNGRGCTLSVRPRSGRGGGSAQIGFRLCITEED